MTDFFAHQNAIVESDKIGKNTRIWAFAHVLPEAKIGDDCNICDHVFIENDVIVGDRVTVKSGVQLWDGISLHDDVFVGPNATFTNDPFPRSKEYPETFKRTVVQQGASIGANATLLPGITIGKYAMVGAGTVVTKDVPPYAIIVGNPARITGYIESKKQYYLEKNKSDDKKIKNELDVNGVHLYKTPLISDLRGSLTFAEYEGILPFDPKRYFLVYDVPSKDIRGEHAHKECHQFLVCVKGSCAVVVDDGVNRTEILLNRPDLGLHIQPMVWATEYKYSADAVLLVLASHLYDADDYIRNYDDFLRETQA